MNILIIQKNKNLSEYLYNSFKESNFSAEIAENFVEGLEKFYFGTYDIIIIDDCVKDIQGKFFCEKIRKENNKVGLVCISDNSDEEVKLNILKNGADDYIIRPISFTEILYRTINLYRRVKSTEINKLSNLKFANFSINLINREFLKENNKIDLTPKEFLLIEYLTRNKGVAISRTAIKEKIWGIDFVNKTNIVEVYINKIRKKIGDEKGKILQSVRGYGYIIKD